MEERRGGCFDNKVKHQNKITSQLLQGPGDREKEVEQVCIRSWDTRGRESGAERRRTVFLLFALRVYFWVN